MSQAGGVFPVAGPDRRLLTRVEVTAPRPLLGGWHAARSVVDTPVWTEARTWLLFWPLLILIAHQAVIIAGPARTHEAYQFGASAVGPRGAHYEVYVDTAYQLLFVVVGWLGIWSALKRNGLLFASLALAFVSALWSVNRVVTVQMSFKVTVCTLLGVYLYTSTTQQRLMRLLIFMGMCLAVLSILFVIFLPSYGLFIGYAGGAWDGICDHKNTLAISSTYLMLPMVFAAGYRRSRRLLYCLLMLFMVVMSQAKGPWLCTLALLGFLGWMKLYRRVRPAEAMLLVVATIGVVAIGGTLFIANWDAIAHALNKDPTMSGRTDIYREVWRSVMKQPFFGYGFGAYWTLENPERNRVGLAIHWTNIGYAESGPLEIALQTGLVGLGIILAMFGRALAQGARLLRSPAYSPRVGLYLSILFYTVLINIDDGWLMTATTMDWVLAVIACIGLNDEMQRWRQLRSYEPVLA